MKKKKLMKKQSILCCSSDAPPFISFQERFAQQQMIKTSGG